MDKCYFGGILVRIEAPFDDFNPKTYRIPTFKYGSDISVVETGYNRVPPGLKQIMKRNVYILHYVIDGQGIFLGEKFDKNCGYVVVPDELEIIQADEKNPYETYWIMFQGAAAKSMLKKCGIAHHNGVFKSDINEQCAEILKKTLSEDRMINEFEEVCILQSAFYQIMALHMRDMEDISKSTSDIAHKVMSFINENYHQEIKINELAKKFNYTRNYLYNLFKKEYGISPQEYLLDLRIEKAKTLFRDKTKRLSVNEVSSAVGFNDCLYFSRLFHKRTGVSPTEFRNNEYC